MTPWTVACQAPLSMEFFRQEYWSGLSFPSPGDLPTRRLNPGLPHCRHILYQLSHQGSPEIPVQRSSWPYNRSLTDECTLPHYVKMKFRFSSVQSLSRVRRCNPMNHSMPGLPVHHHLLEFTQTHVHRVRDAIQLSHLLSSPSPPAPNPSQHQSLFQ